ncbi:MAG: hypothetical protein ACLSA6_01350 [Holdemania massiliensis]
MLPWNTLLLISMSNFIVAYWPFLILGVLFLALGVDDAEGAGAAAGFDELKVRFPLFGTLTDCGDSRCALFSSVFSGISVIDSLQFRRCVE